MYRIDSLFYFEDVSAPDTPEKAPHAALAVDDEYDRNLLRIADASPFDVTVRFVREGTLANIVARVVG